MQNLTLAAIWHHAQNAANVGRRDYYVWAYTKSNGGLGWDFGPEPPLKGHYDTIHPQAVG